MVKPLIRILFTAAFLINIGLLHDSHICINAEIVEKSKIVYPSNKSMFIDLNLTDNKLSLLGFEIINSPGPNYLSGDYEFVAKVLSADGRILGEYGFGDPRTIIGERGYKGPTRLNTVNFPLIIPYFEEAAAVSIYREKFLMLTINVTKEKLKRL